MKQFKKLFLLLGLCAMIITTTANPVSAKTISSKDIKSHPTIQAKIDISGIELGGKVILPDGAILTPISKDEYVSTLAKEKNISIQEAYEMEKRDSERILASKMEKRDSKSLLESASTLALQSSIIYYYYTKNVTYSGNQSYSATLQATLKLYNSGSFRDIEDVLAVSSRRNTGLYTYTWNQTSAYSDPGMGSSDFPTTSVSLFADGYFEIVTSVNLEASGEVVPGFSLGGSIGGNYIYDSETMYMEGYYSLY